MQLIRLGMAMDIAKHDEFYLVADHGNFKFYKLKKSPELEFILNEISKVTTKNLLISKAVENGYDEKIIDQLIEKLIKYTVIEYSEFPDAANIQELQSFRMPELYFSDRFGLQIASFKAYEDRGYNRFDIQEKIRNAEITIIGIGGMGSNIAVMAAAIGVKKIKLIDNDYVEMGNLVRQIFYKESDCNKVKKVHALKRFINEFTSYTEVEVVEDFIVSEETANTYLVKDALVVQTADKPKGFIDWFVNKTCVENKIPVLFTHNNSVGPFYIPGKSACFECFKKYLDEDSRGLYSTMIENLEEGAGSIYPAIVTGPWILSYYLFEEILRYIIGVDMPITMNSILSLKSSSVETVPFQQRDNCICNEKA